MKHSLLPLILAFTLPLARAADTVESSVRFSNNDQLSGSMESLTTDRLVWKSPILEKPVPFLLKNVLDLTLAAEQPEIAAKHEATVTLTNGDMVRGQLASVSDATVELDTWFAGRMKFNRLMIRDVRVSERPDFIYRGPDRPRRLETIRRQTGLDLSELRLPLHRRRQHREEREPAGRVQHRVRRHLAGFLRPQAGVFLGRPRQRPPDHRV